MYFDNDVDMKGFKNYRDCTYNTEYSFVFPANKFGSSLFLETLFRVVPLTSLKLLDKSMNGSQVKIASGIIST